MLCAKWYTSVDSRRLLTVESKSKAFLYYLSFVPPPLFFVAPDDSVARSRQRGRKRLLLCLYGPCMGVARLTGAAGGRGTPCSQVPLGAGGAAAGQGPRGAPRDSEGD
eukprot:1934446-Pyramimonas_sp.AAC.1